MVRTRTSTRGILATAVALVALGAPAPGRADTCATSFLGLDATTQGNRCHVERAYGSYAYALPLAGFAERPIGGDDPAKPSESMLDETGGPGFDGPGPHVSYGVHGPTTAEDKRALENPAQTDRRPTALTGSFFDVFVDLAPGDYTISAYVLDWDSNGRVQTEVATSDDGSDSALTTSSVQGVYERFAVHTGDGNVTLHFEGTTPNAVVSGIFVDASGPVTGVTHLGTDTTTRGDWVGAYGASGYALLGYDAGAGAHPWSASSDVAGNGLAGNYSTSADTFAWGAAYAQGTFTGPAYAFSWTGWLPGATGDPRAQAFFKHHPILDGPPFPGDRRATVWDSGGELPIHADDPNRPMIVNLTLPPTAGSYRMALYFLDYDSTGREQTVTVEDLTNAASDGPRTVSQADGFHDGVYYLYDVAGASTLRITLQRVAGINAVLSGLFLDEIPLAPFGFAGTDATTGSAALNVCEYGEFGYVLANAKSNFEYPIGGNETSEPATPLVDETGGRAFGDYGYAGDLASYHVHGPFSLPDSRAPLHADGTRRRASAAFGQHVVAEVRLPAGSWRLALYSLDWDRNGRVQDTVVGLGGASASHTVNNSTEGVYQKFLVTSDGATPIIVTANLLGGPNAVFSAIFADPVPGPVPAVAFDSVDTTTKGSWIGTYGGPGGGYALIGMEHPGVAYVVDWAPNHDVNGGVLAETDATPSPRPYTLTHGQLWSWTGYYSAAATIRNAYAFAWTGWYPENGDPRGQRFYKFNAEVNGPPNWGDRRAATWDSGDEVHGPRPMYADLHVPANSGPEFTCMRLSLYALDYENYDGRTLRFTLIDHDTSTVLDTQVVGPPDGLGGGVYLRWQVPSSADIDVKVEAISGINAVLGAIFFDELP